MEYLKVAIKYTQKNYTYVIKGVEVIGAIFYLLALLDLVKLFDGLPEGIDHMVCALMTCAFHFLIFFPYMPRDDRSKFQLICQCLLRCFIYIGCILNMKYGLKEFDELYKEPIRNIFDLQELFGDDKELILSMKDFIGMATTVTYLLLIFFVLLIVCICILMIVQRFRR